MQSWTCTTHLVERVKKFELGQASEQMTYVHNNTSLCNDDLPSETFFSC